MRLAVTGGAGYLGSEICRLAVAEGHEVVATQFRRRPPFGEPLQVDIRKPFALDADAVIHTAYVQADADTIVRGTRNVVAAAGGARLVHVSTDLVFDGEHAPYTEDDDPHPVSDYGRAKLEAEALVPPAALIVRTSLLYGKPGGPQEAMAARGGTFYTDEIRCPTRVDELAAALLELAAADAAGVLHLAAPDAVTRYEFAQLLGAHGAHPAPAPPGRPRNVALDSTRAAALLGRPLTGIRALLHS